MSGNSRIPSAQPEAFLPLLSLSALLIGLDALFGHILTDPPPEPVRSIGETGFLGTQGDRPEPENGYAVLLSWEACEQLLAEMDSRWLVYPEVLRDDDQTIWAEAGTAVEVIDASHPKFTGIRILDGAHAGVSGWVWMDNVIRTTER